MSEKKVKSLDDLIEDIKAKADAGNKLIAKGVLTVDFLSEFKDLENEYAAKQKSLVYAELIKSEKPLIAAITKFKYFNFVHKEIKNTAGGTIARIETGYNEKRVDLLDFCKKAEINSEWEYSASRFNKLLCLRTAIELGYTKAQMQKLSDSYYLKEKVRELAQGQTPVSNTQLIKGLQAEVDNIVFEDDGNGKNIYKVISKDVNYLLKCYTKEGKKDLTIAVSNDSKVRRFITAVLHHLVTGNEYGVTGFKTIEEVEARLAELKAKSDAKKAAEAEAASKQTKAVPKVTVKAKSKKSDKIAA